MWMSFLNDDYDYVIYFVFDDKLVVKVLKFDQDVQVELIQALVQLNSIELERKIGH